MTPPPKHDRRRNSRGLPIRPVVPASCRTFLEDIEVNPLHPITVIVVPRPQVFTW